MKSKLGFAIAAGILGLGLSMHPVHLLSQESQREEAGDRQAGQMAANNASTEPNMASALRHLQAAEDALEKATPNKGGHREKALELTRQARTQVEQGIQYFREHAKDKRH